MPNLFARQAFIAAAATLAAAGPALAVFKVPADWATGWTRGDAATTYQAWDFFDPPPSPALGGPYAPDVADQNANGSASLSAATTGLVVTSTGNLYASTGPLAVTVTVPHATGAAAERTTVILQTRVQGEPLDLAAVRLNGVAPVYVGELSRVTLPSGPTTSDRVELWFRFELSGSQSSLVLTFGTTAINAALQALEVDSFTQSAAAGFVAVTNQGANVTPTTSTPTPTATTTATPTFTATSVPPTATATATATPTATATASATATATFTATSVPPTATATATATPTFTATSVPPTATATGVPPTATATPTFTATGVPPTATATSSATATATATPTFTATSLPPTATATPSATATSVAPTATATATFTATTVPSTASPTATPTPTATIAAGGGAVVVQQQPTAVPTEPQTPTPLPTAAPVIVDDADDTQGPGFPGLFGLVCGSGAPGAALLAGLGLLLVRGARRRPRRA